MKHFFLIMAALLSLAACSRNSGTDEPAPQPASPILGTWKFTGLKYINGANGSEFDPQTANNCDGRDTFIFKADGTAVETRHYYSGSNCNARTNNYTYSYNAETKELTLTRSVDGFTTTHQVIKLDNNTFEYVYSFYDKNSDGTLDKNVFIYTRAN